MRRAVRPLPRSTVSRATPHRTTPTFRCGFSSTRCSSTPAENVPYAYAYYDRSFWLYPVPGAVYTVRPIGAIEMASPAADDTANNVWMVDAYELVRCRAKLYLAVHVLKDTELALTMKAAERDALSQLTSATGKRVSTGRLTATAF